MNRARKAEALYLDLIAAVDELGGVPCSIFPDAYFPEDLGPGELQGRKMARELCQRCPLRLQCLEYALEAREQFGIWGGLTTRERQILNAKRRAGEAHNGKGGNDSNI